MLKRRWPILKSMRNHVDNAMAIILTCCILHNVAIKWDAEDPPDDAEDSDEDEEGVEEDVIIDDDLDNARIRAQGAMVRENLRENMPPPTASERRRINM